MYSPEIETNYQFTDNIIDLVTRIGQLDTQFFNWIITYLQIDLGQDGR